MVRIIGEDPQAFKQVTCRNCATKLEYTQSEVKNYKSYDYSGGCDVVHHIDCPKCGKEVNVQGY